MTLATLLDLLKGDAQAERAVPPTGYTARITLFSAAVMAFLAVFALALSQATGRLAEQWAFELAQTATVRVTASEGSAEAQVQDIMELLNATPGIQSARVLTEAEQQALLEPWFGPELPVATLSIPQLIEVVTYTDDLDTAALRAALEDIAPDAIFDDHTRWREPLIAAANRLRLLGWLSIALIGATIAAIITLAARAALAANTSVIHVLRIVGATDAYIARAFVRRFTLRGLGGATIGMLGALFAIWMLPDTEAAGGFLGGVGFTGVSWLWALTVPLFSGLAAFVATRTATRRALKDIP